MTVSIVKSHGVRAGEGAVFGIGVIGYRAHCDECGYLSIRVSYNGANYNADAHRKRCPKRKSS